MALSVMLFPALKSKPLTPSRYSMSEQLREGVRTRARSIIVHNSSNSSSTTSDEGNHHDGYNHDDNNDNDDDDDTNNNKNRNIHLVIVTHYFLLWHTCCSYTRLPGRLSGSRRPPRHPGDSAFGGLRFRVEGFTVEAEKLETQ